MLSTFNDYVKRVEIARVEGVLLRYLSQLHDTLARTIPEKVKNDEIHDMIGYFRSLIATTRSTKSGPGTCNMSLLIPLHW